MQETESIDEYILQHIDAESDYLKALYRDTHVKLLRPRMASGFHPSLAGEFSLCGQDPILYRRCSGACSSVRYYVRSGFC